MSHRTPSRPRPTRPPEHGDLAPRVRSLVVLAGLAAALCSPLAHAQTDDYSEVARLLRAGQFDQALAQADQYLASRPRDPQMRFLKGLVQTESGQPDQALDTFSRLTQDFPELPEPYNNLAVLHAEQGRFDQARAALDMAIRSNPGYATAHENLGDVYARLAAQSYTRATQLDAGSPTLALKLRLIRSLLAPGAEGGGAGGS